MSSPHSESLFVAWQDPIARSILPVARLVRCLDEDGNFYEFSYLRGAEQAASEQGFLPFLSFPSLTRLYRSRDLPPFFKNRLMTSSRPDYPRYLAELGLKPSDAAEPMTVLARSSGLRSTDHVELFAPPRLREDNKYETYFLVRGIRHVPYAEQRTERLKSGDQLYCLRDFQNDSNSHAIAVRTSDKQILGYVADYLCCDLTKILESGGDAAGVQITVVKVNPTPAPVHHRLLCRLVALAPEGFHPFSDDQFRPIVDTASEASRAA
jgi:hypothetical protein